MTPSWRFSKSIKKNTDDLHKNENQSPEWESSPDTSFEEGVEITPAQCNDWPSKYFCYSYSINRLCFNVDCANAVCLLLMKPLLYPYLSFFLYLILVRVLDNLDNLSSENCLKIYILTDLVWFLEYRTEQHRGARAYSNVWTGIQTPDSSVQSA
jgi:hypothetical protein